MRLETITGKDFNNRYKLAIFDMDGTILNTHEKLLEYGAKTIIDKPEEILDLIIQS